MAGGSGKGGTVVDKAVGAAKAAGTAIADAATKLVGGDDSARERAEGFAERAEEHRAQVAAEDAKADYERAKLNAVESFGRMPQTGPYQLRFATADETFLDGATDVTREDLNDEVPERGGQATYGKLTDFTPDGPSETVIEAWLIAPSGEAVRSYVGTAGLAVGGGRSAQIPAGHLLF